MEVAAGKAYLTFGHAGSGLVLAGDGGFEVRGADGAYVPAVADLADGNRVVVWSEAVREPVAVRYAWASVPEVSLFNREGLPASPFRTSEP
jgi:sialate O-acetylesterase